MESNGLLLLLGDERKDGIAMSSIASKSAQTSQIHFMGSAADNKYPLIPLTSIQVVERPEEGDDDRLFYNPRSIESMTDEVMGKLRESIRRDGLHTPLIVRAFTDNNTTTGKVVRVELVAGERRYRSLCRLVDEDTLVFNWKTKAMAPASMVYTHVPCEVYYNIPDEEALRHAWTENDEHEPLSISEEIHLVERLARRGLLQEEIASLLGTNVTWVSQTGNFRKELPEEAFERLENGKISRHVAVKILSYNRTDREVLVREAIKIEEEETAEALKKIRGVVEDAEDAEGVLEMRARQARERGDSATNQKITKKAGAAHKRLNSARTKESRIRSKAGVIQQGHIAKGAMAAHVSPRKATVLTRSMIDQFLNKLPQKWMENGKIDPILKKAYPKELMAVISATAEAILNGHADPGAIIRKTLVSLDIWEMPEGVVEPEMELLDIEEGDQDID